MNDILCALVGLGNIGFEYKRNFNNFFQNHSKALNSINRLNLIAGVDKSPNKRRNFSKKYNINSFKNLTELKKRNNPNFFVVSVNTKDLTKIIKEIVNKFNPKVIVCEKPISFNYNNVLEIIKLCRKKKIKFFVNFQRRSDPSFINLKKIINKKKSQIFKGKVFYEKGFIYNCCHYINLMLFLFGNYKNHKIIKIKKISKNDYKIDTEIKFERATINFIYKNKTNKELEIKKKDKLILKNKNSPLTINSAKFAKTFKMSQRYFYLELLKNLYNKKNNICDINETIMTFKLIFLIINNSKK